MGFAFWGHSIFGDSLDDMSTINKALLYLFKFVIFIIIFYFIFIFCIIFIYWFNIIFKKNKIGYVECGFSSFRFRYFRLIKILSHSILLNIQFTHDFVFCCNYHVNIYSIKKTNSRIIGSIRSYLSQKISINYLKLVLYKILSKI